MFPAESFQTAGCPSEFGVDRIHMNQEDTIDFQLTDRSGCAIPIEVDGSGNPTLTPAYIVREMYWAGQFVRKTPVVVDGPEGLVEVSFSCSDFYKWPGMYLAEFALFDGDCKQVSMLRYLEVSPGLTYTNNGAITIAEIRLALRDYCPEANTLLDDYEFKDVEIAFCIRRPIDLWNETTPNVDTYTPATFPWREHWMIGTIGYLLRISAHHYRRNNLTYSAAGVSVNDKDKFNQYDNVAELRIREYKEWMMRKKMELNIAKGFGTFGSPYRWMY